MAPIAQNKSVNIGTLTPQSLKANNPQKYSSQQDPAVLASRKPNVQVQAKGFTKYKTPDDILMATEKTTNPTQSTWKPQTVLEAKKPMSVELPKIETPKQEMPQQVRDNLIAANVSPDLLKSNNDSPFSETEHDAIKKSKFFTRDQVKKLIDNAPSDEIKGQIVDGLITKWYKLEWYETNDWDWSTKSKVGNFTKWVFWSIIEWWINLWQVVDEYMVAPVLQKLFSDKKRANKSQEEKDQVREKMKEQFREIIWVSDEWAYTAWENTGEIWQLFLPTPWGKSRIVTAIASKADDIAAWMKYWEKAVKYGKMAVDGAVDVQKYSAISEWEIAWPWETAIGAILNPTLSAAWAFAGNVLKKWKELVTNTITKDEAIARVIQWKPKDLQAGKNILPTINTKWVKDYKQLWDVLEQEWSKAMQELDEILLTTNKTVWPKDTIIKTAVWDTTVSSNPVSRAIGHLEELYAKIWDDIGSATIAETKKSFDSGKLSIKQLNDLAREYGSKLSAFSTKTWDPLTSVWSQMLENTRKWLKEISRDQLWIFWETAKALDSRYSDISTLKTLANKVHEKAYMLSNRVEKRGFGEKIGRKIWYILDLVTAWWIKWIAAKFIPSNQWYKSFNYLDIQDDLAKNLKILEKLDNVANNTFSNSRTITKLDSIIGELRSRGVSVGAVENG